MRTRSALIVVTAVALLLVGCSSSPASQPLGDASSAASSSPTDTQTQSSRPPETATSSVSPHFKTVPVSSLCDAAMRKAAKVPLDQLNNDEMFAAAAACTTADEFVSALFKHPNALGFTNPTQTDAYLALAATCTLSKQSSALATCIDAKTQGIIK